MAIDVTTAAVAIGQFFLCKLWTIILWSLTFIKGQFNPCISSLLSKCQKSNPFFQDFVVLFWVAPPVFRPQFTCQHDYCWTSNCYRQKRDHKLNTLKQSWKLLKETLAYTPRCSPSSLQIKNMEWKKKSRNFFFRIFEKIFRRNLS